MSQRRLLVHLVRASGRLLGPDRVPPGGGEVGEGVARGGVRGLVAAKLGGVARGRARSELEKGQNVVGIVI